MHSCNTIEATCRESLHVARAIVAQRAAVLGGGGGGSWGPGGGGGVEAHRRLEAHRGCLNMWVTVEAAGHTYHGALGL
jgi:hypothetical protein